MVLRNYPNLVITSVSQSLGTRKLIRVHPDYEFTFPFKAMMADEACSSAA
jgi:hypothetical protein